MRGKNLGCGRASAHEKKLRHSRVSEKQDNSTADGREKKFYGTAGYGVSETQDNGTADKCAQQKKKLITHMEQRECCMKKNWSQQGRISAREKKNFAAG